MKERNLKIVNKNIEEPRKNILTSYFLFFLRLFLAILIAIIVPLLFLIILLIKEPQEIEVINKLIDQKIVENNLISKYKYSSAKIGIDKKLRLNYNIHDLEINYDDNFIVFPKISFKFSIRDLLLKIFVVDEVKVNKLVGYIGYNLSEGEKSKNLIIDDISELQFKIYELIRYIHRENKIINSLSISNSSFYIFDKNSNSVNKIDVFDSKIKLFGKLNEIININTKLKLKINENSDFVNTVFNCSIKNNDDINCNFGINNFKVGSIDFVGLLGSKNKELQESLDSIDGLFNFESNLNFSNYINFDQASFKLYSNTGSFFIQQVFGDKITYKNLIVDGVTDSFDNIELKSVRINVISDSITELQLSLDYYKNKNMKIDIDINNAFVKDIRVFWPIFLDDYDIRKWVIEHINSGNINKAFAYMNFDFVDNEFILSSIKSEINFKNTSIDYHESFPVITNIDAKAIFTVDDMNVYIEKAKMANTTLSDAKVYIDFLDKTSTINITTSAKGDIYELFYFVNNNDREKVKDLVTRYVDGYAYTKANIMIPITDFSLEKTYIKVDSNVKNNNTFIFEDNSDLKIDLSKDIGAKTFNISLDCKNAFINFPIIDFVKNKNEELKILLDVIVQDDRVLLANIKPIANDKINFFGNGNIESGILSELNFDYVNYGNTKFNVLYTDKPNENPDIFVNIENMNLKKEINKEEIIKIFSKDNDKEDKKYLLNADIKFQIANLIFNEKYNVTNTFILVSIEKGELKQLELKNKSDGSSELFIEISNIPENDIKYKINLECTNLGTFLSNSLITNNLVYGNFYFNGVIDNKSKFSGKFLLNEDFHIIIKNIKDAEFFNYVLNNENISEKIKNDLKNQNMITFNKLRGNIEFQNGTLNINDIAASSGDIFGIGISGNGFMNINSGTIKLEGFIVPLEKLNKLLGLNKIPIINQILFSGEDKGLVTVDYSITKDNYNSNFEFSITKANGINNITPINSMLRFLSIQNE